MRTRGARRAHPGDVVSRPRTGGTGDVSTAVAGPAIHSNSETGRLVSETRGLGMIGSPSEDDGA